MKSICRVLFGDLSSPILSKRDISKNNIAYNFAPKFTRQKCTLKTLKLDLMILQIFHFLTTCMLLFVHFKVTINYMLISNILKSSRVKYVLILREKYEFGWIVIFQRIIPICSRANLMLIKRIWWNKFWWFWIGTPTRIQNHPLWFNFTKGVSVRIMKGLDSTMRS